MEGLKHPRVAIIDDNFEEVRPLLSALWKESIGAVYYSGQVEEQPKVPFDSIRLVFLDLRLYALTNLVGSQYVRHAASVLKKIVRSPGHATGIVVWTKHEEDVKHLRDSLADKDEGFDPAFLVSLPNKLELTHNPERLRDKLSSVLEGVPAHRRLWSWEKHVADAADDVTLLLGSTVRDLFDTDSPPGQATVDAWLNGLLCNLAHASREGKLPEKYPARWLYETLSRLHSDRVEARTEATLAPLKAHGNRKELSESAKCRINTMLLTALPNEDTPIARPGSVYIWKNKQKYLFRKLHLTSQNISAPILDFGKNDTIKKCETAIGKFEWRKKATGIAPERAKKLRQDIRAKRAQITSCRKQLRDQCVPLLLEVSPACNIANDKRPVARFIAGLFVPDSMKQLLKQDLNHKRVDHLIHLPGSDNQWTMVLDANQVFGIHMSRFDSNLRPTIMLREGLLQDIQAWYTGYASRPGYLAFEEQSKS